MSKVNFTVDQYYLHLAALGFATRAFLHDLRNALSVISGHIQMWQLKGISTPEEAENRLEVMAGQVERIEKALGLLSRFQHSIVHQDPVTYPHQVWEVLEYIARHGSLVVPIQLNPPPAFPSRPLALPAGVAELAIATLTMKNTSSPFTTVSLNSYEEGEWWIVLVQCQEESHKSLNPDNAVNFPLSPSLLSLLESKQVRWEEIRNENGVTWKLSFPLLNIS